MTNEEKAREIANRAIIGYGPNYLDVAEEAIFEMAEWKDRQFKEYLEKKKENIVKKWGLLGAAEVSTLDMVINELFGGK